MNGQCGAVGTLRTGNGPKRLTCTRPAGHTGDEDRYTGPEWHDDAVAGACWPRETVTYCDECGRIKGVGCSCGLTFAEKIQGVAATVPDHMRAIPRLH